MSDRRMAEYMIRTVSDNLDKVLKTSNSYTKVISKDGANAIVFEGDENSESKRACGQHQVEKLIVVAFSRSSINGVADIILFDCATGNKKAGIFDLDTTFNDKYYLEKDLNKVLEKLYKGNIGLLSSSS